MSVTEKYKKFWGLCTNECNGQKFTPVEESNRIKEAHSNRWEEDIYDLRFMLLKSYCQAQVHGLPSHMKQNLQQNKPILLNVD